MAEEYECEYVCPPEFNEKEEIRKLYVSGLTNEVTDKEFKEFFSQYGEVEGGVIIRRDDKSPFGFITFKYCDDVDECLLHKKDLVLKGVSLQIKRAVPKNDKSGTAHLKVKQLYVSNITPDMTEDQLKQYLERRHPKKYGTIEKILLIKKKDEAGNQTPKNKGFGFIDVSTEDLADRIAIGEASFNIGGMSRPQNIVKAMPRDQALATMGGGGDRRGHHSGPSAPRRRGRGGSGAHVEEYYDIGYGGYDDGSGYYGYDDFKSYGQDWGYDDGYGGGGGYSQHFRHRGFPPQGRSGQRGSRGGPRVRGNPRYNPY